MGNLVTRLLLLDVGEEVVVVVEGVLALPVLKIDPVLLSTSSPIFEVHGSAVG